MMPNKKERKKKMKVVILAGGLGTRLAEETCLKPKPMVEIGEKPIIWHIMKIFSEFGYDDFVICCGHKSNIIKKYFIDYTLSVSDITVDMEQKRCFIHKNMSEKWKVTLVETGEYSLTGERIRRIKDYIPEGESFFMTYGDGVGNVDINALLQCHKNNRKLATMTVVQPLERFGVLQIGQDGIVNGFIEKPEVQSGWINAGFFVLDYKCFDYIKEGNVIFEKEPLVSITQEGQLNAYQHKGFWKCMDTIKDKIYLEQIWNEGMAQWKIWN